MKEDIARFLEDLKLKKGHADNTISAYKTDLNQFVEWFVKSLNGHPASWSYLSGALIGKYVGYLAASGYKTTTIARKVSAVRSLTYYLSKTGKVPFSRTGSLPSAVRVKKQKPRVIEDDKMERLLAVVASDEGRISRRNRSLFYLICATGLNITEAVNLDLSDIDIDQAQVSVRGKRSRILRIDERTVLSLLDYIEEERPDFLIEENTQALFLCHGSGKRLDRSYFWEALQNYAQKAGLSGLDLNCRSLRSTFAAKQFQEGSSLNELGEILGHKNQLTTRKYRTPTAQS